MARNDGYRRYIEAATVLGQITRARAEDLVRELMSGGEMQRSQAQQWVDELIDRSRKATEDLLGLVRTEVANQLEHLGIDPDDLARQAAEILRRSAAAGRRTVRDASTGRAADAGAPAHGAKKAGTKKAGAKKAGAKKAGAKKPAAKAPAPTAPAKKAPGAKAAGAKKASGTKAAGAKKAAGTKAAGAKKASKSQSPGRAV